MIKIVSRGEEFSAASILEVLIANLDQGAVFKVIAEGRDAAGTGLCTSGVGTGINAHNRPNGLPSRYGDSGTGGCGGQIRVSDVENAPAH